MYREVAIHRLKDGAVLLQQGRYNGAIYLAGYAIECQLKYAYCRRWGCVYLPASLEVHDWEVIVEKTQLRKDMQVQTRMYALYQALADQWGPALRYRTRPIGKTEAERLYRELEELYQFVSELVP